MKTQRIAVSLLIALLLTPFAIASAEQNLGRHEAAEVPVLREIFESQFQTLLRLEGSKAHGKGELK
jgi:hypothetical protein